MTRPAGFVESDWYKWEVLNVALALHQHHTGSGDPMGYHEFKQAREWLQWRLDEWRESAYDECSQFDNAVKFVLITALQETKGDWSKICNEKATV